MLTALMVRALMALSVFSGHVVLAAVFYWWMDTARM